MPQHKRFCSFLLGLLDHFPGGKPGVPSLKTFRHRESLTWRTEVLDLDPLLQPCESSTLEAGPPAPNRFSDKYSPADV